MELKQIERNELGISLRIAVEEGVTYRTEFIGTRQQEGSGSENMEDSPGIEVGVIFSVVEGAAASYEFRGDELFVRARVVSSVLKENPYSEGEYEQAWIQPVTRR